MERYHIFKLGLAILFYATYCIGLMNGQEIIDNIPSNSSDPDDFLSYYQGVEGRPGVDFPILSHIPRTNFNCREVDSGYYADLETDCQVFHICEDGKKISFLCPNGTIFQQSDLICEWWTKVNCTNSPNLYDESAEKWQNQALKRKASRRVFLDGDNNHGAILRTEELSSVTAIKNGKQVDFNVERHEGRGREEKQRNRPRANDNEDEYTKFENRNKNFYYNSNNYGDPNEEVKPKSKSRVTYNVNNNYNSNQNNNNNGDLNQKVKSKSKNGVNYNLNNNYNLNQDNNNKQGEPNKLNNNADKVFISAGRVKTLRHNHSRKNIRNDSNKIKLTLSTSISSSGQANNQHNLKTNNQHQGKNIKLIASNVDNHANVESRKYIRNEEEKINRSNIPSNRGGFKYNQNPDYIQGLTNVIGSSNKNAQKIEKPSPVYKKEELRSTIPDHVNNYYASSTPIVPILSNDEDFKFPLHDSENPKQYYSKVDIQNKNQVKQESTVPLTRNDLYSKKVEADLNEETQITEESSSFFKSPLNTIQDSLNKISTPNPYPNHRTTYSDLKTPDYSSTKFSKTINSVTPQYLTTQPINNGKPFVGSRVGTSLSGMNGINVNPTASYRPTTLQSFKVNTEKSSVYSSKSTSGHPRKYAFNLGQTEKYTSPSTTPIPSTTYTLPRTSYFNGEKTSLSELTSKDIYTKTPLSLFVPDKFDLGLNSSSSPKKINHVKFNLGLGKVNVTHDTSVSEPKQPVDHQIVYGNFPKIIRTTTLPSFDINQGVQIKFDKNSNKVAIQLAKAVASTSSLGSVTPSTTIDKFPATVSSTPNPLSSSSSGFTLGAEPSSYYGRNIVQKPRPFEKYNENKFGYSTANFNSVTPTYPTYKISSASPFTVAPTLPTTEKGSDISTKGNSVFENVDNMISVLKEIVKTEEQNDYENETPRPGLIVPPSVGPQTLHTLAQYFANALDGIAAEKERNGNTEVSAEMEEKYDSAKESLTALLTKMTMEKYKDLFKKYNETKVEINTKNTDENSESLHMEHSTNFVETPHIRQLARNFSLALSSYLDDPVTFRKDLKELRPTEPPLINDVETATENVADEELLNFSDADSKSSYPPIFPTVPSAVPTWGYILAYNISKENNNNNNYDIKNSLNPDLQSADSQSFVPGFNNINSDVKKRKNLTTDLPQNHWTSSPDATNLLKTTFGLNPVSLNTHFGTTVRSIDENDSDSFDTSKDNEEINESISEEILNSKEPFLHKPQSEINYELRQLPSLNLNSTQVHGILIDFMNNTKSDNFNRLQRILQKLNTTEDEFLVKMKEIESNPLTKRLILLLISECGANISNGFRNEELSPLLNVPDEDPSHLITRSTAETPRIKNSNIADLVDPNIAAEDHDARALQLLNSLYSIASRFGK
ncbi:unnamed protein product [Brassicogethes aeneus]|uniref:Chitin-binding type-2 domain-containing protein n=1 Tax=Brassicogethes aeneus TaxID=1431903 RepID=A0A9P0B3C8_BRAAE|nr:unnamed protein product [Brassicogethes aeneus]